MTSEILDVGEIVKTDTSIEKCDYIEQPCEQGDSAINTDGGSLRFVFNASDNFILPSESYLRVEGQFKTTAGANWQTTARGSAIAFVNNGVLNLFNDFKYELGGTEIESFDSALVITVHNYLTKSRTYQGLHWFWEPDKMTPGANINNKSFLVRNSLTYAANTGIWYFSACVPLKVIFNFCNDYTKILYGVKNSISMKRRDSSRALLRLEGAIGENRVFPALTAVDQEGVINLSALRWVMPYVSPNAIFEANLLNKLSVNKDPIDVTFLNKKSTFITVPITTDFGWPLGTYSGVERPRYIVVVFQVGTFTDQLSNSSAFSINPNVTKAYVNLAGRKYPSEDMNTDSAQNKYTKWYREYVSFYNKYNNENKSEPCLSYVDFIKVAPMYVFDISNQPETLQGGVADIKLYMKFSANPQDNTTAHAVIYYDSRYLVSVTNISKQVTQIL